MHQGADGGGGGEDGDGDNADDVDDDDHDNDSEDDDECDRHAPWCGPAWCQVPGAQEAGGAERGFEKMKKCTTDLLSNVGLRDGAEQSDSRIHLR